ncbi:helix-turn-helix domain-containing protein [Streptomyces sp. NPDC001584]|uniref:helix-turn-helix domain-containing protein n=1 Tax=Streptomyces sp. NPDC001584 TaxID=3154521 RepID=UPI00332ABEE6
MWSVVSASELPVRERFDWFSDTLSREVVPTALSTERPAEFQAEAAVPELQRLGTVAADLVAACPAQHLDAEAELPAEVRTQALLQRVYAFIDHNLADPALTPSAIAARHHVSVRTLHQLFRRQEEPETVQARIRRRRRERCHSDLARPEPMGHPVNAIAARWGFSGPAVFSRSFRERYGLTRVEFRALSAKDGRTARTSS